MKTLSTIINFLKLAVLSGCLFFLILIYGLVTDLIAVNKRIGNEKAMHDDKMFECVAEWKIGTIDVENNKN